MPWYCAREDVKSSLDIKHTAIANTLVDREIAAASRSVEGTLHRRFYPELRRIKLDYPQYTYAPAWQVWLDDNEMISVVELSSGSGIIPSNAYNLRRMDGKQEPPYSYLELSTASGYAFSGDPTFQQAIDLYGWFGHSDQEEIIGTLTAQLDAPEDSPVAVTWNTPRLGVGNLLRIDDERMIITERSWIAAGQNIGSNLTAKMSDIIVAVTDGTAFAAEETILVDGEKMYVTDVAGNNLLVKRAWDGSPLAVHTSATAIYTLMGVQLTRAQVGTTAAIHAADAIVYRWKPPALLKELTVAEALVTLNQAAASYAVDTGSGETKKDTPGRGLPDIRQQAIRELGRKMRLGAV